MNVSTHVGALRELRDDPDVYGIPEHKEAVDAAIFALTDVASLRLQLEKASQDHVAVLRMLVRRATLMDHFRAWRRKGHWLHKAHRELLIAGEPRYTLTDLGKAYRAVMQQGAKLNGEVKAGEE